MGNWAIHIEGIGAHHNDAPYDAERIAAECVERLIEAGHSIVSKTFTYGGSFDIPVLLNPLLKPEEKPPG